MPECGKKQRRGVAGSYFRRKVRLICIYYIYEHQKSKETRSAVMCQGESIRIFLLTNTINTSQNLKYKNGSSNPRYIQYRLPSRMINRKAVKSTLLFTFFNNLYGNVVDKNIPAMKKR